MRNFNHTIGFTAILLTTLTGCQKIISPKTGTLKITFRNTVNRIPMVLNTTSYNTSLGETFTVNKFKYYISNIKAGGNGSSIAESNSNHLIDESVTASRSFAFEVEENTFSGIGFLLGVDSLRNVSGAQTGALDPLNDMFCTWNSGYVMAKMEGTSPQSNQFGNRIEYHLGGFAGPDNVVRQVNLNLPAPAVIKEGGSSEIVIDADLNTWWQNPYDLKIVNLPVCTTPGPEAKKIADNYSKMFSVSNVINN